MRTSGSRNEERLEQAAKIFSEKGFSDTTVQDIADALGISKVGAYYHMGSKEEFFHEILMAGLSPMVERVEEIRGYPISHADRLKLALRESVRMTVESSVAKVAVLLHNDIRFLAPEHKQEWIDCRDRFESLWIGLIEEGAKAGEWPSPKDTRVIVFALLGSVHHLARWYKPDGRLSPDGISGLWWDFVRQGLGLPVGSGTLTA